MATCYLLHCIGAQIYEFFDNAKTLIRFKAYEVEIGGCQHRLKTAEAHIEGSLDTAGAKWKTCKYFKTFFKLHSFLETVLVQNKP